MVAATGPEMILGKVDNATNIENCVPVNCLFTKRINKATNAVEPIPATKLSENTAIANSTIFFPDIANMTKKTLVSACSKPKKNNARYKEYRINKKPAVKPPNRIETIPSILLI